MWMPGKLAFDSRAWVPVPALLVAGVAVTLLYDVPLELTTRIGDVGDTTLYGGNLPACLVTSRVLSGSLVVWVGALVSFLVRLARALPLDVIRLLAVRGVDGRQIIGALAICAGAHGLVYWLSCFLPTLALCSLVCGASSGVATTAMLEQAGVPAAMTGVVPNLEACLVGAVGVACALVISAMLLVASARWALATVAMPALYACSTWATAGLAQLFPALEGVAHVMDVLVACLLATPSAFSAPLGGPAAMACGALAALTMGCLSVLVAWRAPRALRVGERRHP